MTTAEAAPTVSVASVEARLRELQDRDVWSDGDVPATYTPLLCVGGGLGSFTLVDFLRIAGVPAADIRIVSPQAQPHDSFRYLCTVSQMSATDPMRSDAMSRVDNIWGWPSYALEEAVRTRRIEPLWRVLTEPVLSEFYNPTVGTVCSGVEREAARIGWPGMLVPGQVSTVRRRAEGGYFAVVHRLDAFDPVVYRCDFVHVAVGYPSLRLLPDVQAYRERFPDHQRIVHSYEPHGHVYEALARRSGTVVVRGAGIAASRVLQRLIDDRDAHGTDTQIVQLFRHYTRGPVGPRLFRRPGGHGFNYQPFTFPKGAGGGQLRDKVLRLEGVDRADIIKAMGGSTTARRKVWEEQLARGRRQGWYRAMSGEVTRFDRAAGGTVVADIRLDHSPPVTLAADYVIDATGLEPDVRQHALLAELLDHAGAQLNPLGRLDVDVDFEMRGTRSGAGRMYASGAATLGGYLAPVDSFWGLSHAALEICDSLARNGFCHKIGALRSFRQWLRWMRNVPI